MGKKENVHLPNPFCRKSFTANLKTLNLQQNPNRAILHMPLLSNKN